jgi:hypothetical protein
LTDVPTFDIYEANHLDQRPLAKLAQKIALNLNLMRFCSLFNYGMKLINIKYLLGLTDGQFKTNMSPFGVCTTSCKEMLLCRNVLIAVVD